MSDNPFSEPEDDRTVIRPAAGARRAASVQPAPLPADEPRTPAISVTPLATAAAPLLQLLARLRNTLHQPNVAELHESTLRELRNFERRALDAGIPMEQLRPAHFALCASLDAVVLNTPWGSASDWRSRSLLVTFHHGSRGPDQLHDVLGQLSKDAEQFRPALEIIYLCASLVSAGRSPFDHLREQTYTLLAPGHDKTEPALSPNWQGIAAPYRPSRANLPIWIVATIALAVCGALFVWTSSSLNAASDMLEAQAASALPAHMPQLTRAAIVQPLPPVPKPPEPTIIDRLQSTLQPEIGRGLVTVLGTAATPIVRITNLGMFATGGATVQPTFVPLLERIAAALKDQSGSLQVVGYTDNQPIRTVQFPSNFQLSAARAQAVRDIIARTIGDSMRLRSEGRADADPIASNATREGREQNQRIEIVLRRPD